MFSFFLSRIRELENFCSAKFFELVRIREFACLAASPCRVKSLRSKQSINSYKFKEMLHRHFFPHKNVNFTKDSLIKMLIYYIISS